MFTCGKQRSEFQSLLLLYPEAPYLSLARACMNSHAVSLHTIEVGISTGLLQDPHYSMLRYGKPSENWRAGVEAILHDPQYSTCMYREIVIVCLDKGIYPNSGIASALHRKMIKDPFANERNLSERIMTALRDNPESSYAEIGRMIGVHGTHVGAYAYKDPHRESRPYFGMTPKERMLKMHQKQDA